MKNLLIALLIFTLPVISLAQVPNEFDIRAAQEWGMEPLEDDLKKANEEIKTCLEDFNAAMSSIEKGVKRCVRRYIATSFVSFCEHKRSSFHGENKDVRKARLDFQENTQIIAVTDGIKLLREDYPVGEKFVKGEDEHNEDELKRKAINAFFVFLTVGVPVTGVGAVVGRLQRLGVAKALRGTGAKFNEKASHGYKAGAKAAAIPALAGGAVGAVATMLKESKEYIYGLAGTEDLCKIDVNTYRL